MTKQSEAKFHPAYLVLLTLAVALFFYTSANVIIASILGIGIGVIMGPSLTFLRKKFNIPRALSAFLCMLGVFAILGGVSYSLGLVVSDQAEKLIERSPKLAANLDKEINSFFADHPKVKAQLKDLDISTAIQSTTKKFFIGLQSMFEGLALAGFALVISMYIGVSLKYYYESLIQFFFPSSREKANEVLKECASKLRKWFKAQILVMLILGLITSFGLWIVGVEYWALYGLLTAVFSLVPYVGILIVVTCAVLITLSSNAALVPWVILVFILTQQIEGNVIIPLLMKDQLELPEAPLLIFILLCGGWIGVIGIFIAPPLFTVLKVLYSKLYIPWVEAHS